MTEPFETGNAFAIPDIWRESSLSPSEAQKSPGETPRLSPISRTTFDRSSRQCEIECGSLTEDSAGPLGIAIPITSFALPTLDISEDDPLRARNTKHEQESIGPFAYGPIPDIVPSDTSSTSSECGETEGPGDALTDLWSAKDVLDPLPQLDIQTWEIFHDKSFKEPPNVLVSEAGPRVFDAFIRHDPKGYQ
ncbi:MAG: hypothetical protein Q9174_005604, partial [Haloplaca sp. 1 TL-2023]